MESGSVSMGSKLNTALTTNVDPGTLMDEFVGYIPYIGKVLPVVFAIGIARKLVKGLGKGKVRI